MLNESRSSRRCAQVRRIRDETASAVVLYISISWMPAAKVSSVGASPVVMRERRQEMAEGAMGGWVVDEDASSDCGCVFGGGFKDASIDCCEGSSRDGLIWLGFCLGYRSDFG